MKIKNRDLASLQREMTALANMLPIKEAYWLGREIKKVVKESTELSEALQAVFQRHSTPVKDRPNQSEVKPALVSKYNKDRRTILDEEIEIDLKPITIDQLESLKNEGKHITAEMLIGLEPIIIEPEK